MSRLDSQSLAQLFATHKVDLSTQRFVCAVSGGLDSVVLLHLMAQLSTRVRCMHIHHGLHEDADQWLALCQQTAAQLKLDFVSRRITLNTDTNLEERCRELRYQHFGDELGDGEMLLTAHHLDDQIETFFLQLMRGAGLAGLRSMPVMPVNFAHGTHFRALLGYSRTQIAAYAKQHQLMWIDDPSNTQQRFERNFLRQELLPILFARREGLRETINRSIGLINDADHLLEALAQNDAHISDDGQRLELTSLLEFDDVRVANAIRYWLKRAQVNVPNRQRLVEAIRQFRTAEQDRIPTLAWSTFRVQRYRDDLYLSHQKELPQAVSRADIAGGLSTDNWLELPPGSGALSVALEMAQGLNPQLLSLQRLVVRYRQNGEQILRESGQHQSLKHWFQEQGIPPFLRPVVPMLYFDDELVAIADMWINPRYRAPQDTSGWQILWRRPKRLLFS